MIRILIADDHDIVRAGLRRLLETEPDLEIVAEADDGDRAVELARNLRPDVVIVDLAMPRLGGLACLAILKPSLPETRFIIFSMFEKESFVKEAIQAGASGYVLKGGASGDVIAAVRAVCHGDRFFSRRLLESMDENALPSTDRAKEAGYQALSSREKQVFRMMIHGKSTNEMGDLLCVSPKTVEKYRTSIHKKLGLKSNVDLMKYALQTGLVEVDDMQLQ
ncbi:MAG: DNA-binding response regulator [Desulfuromonas sp.]|nr:MAG: DNA-binding response regulator [Desulfuromonas sp.]